jgi:hypothetical protein
MPASRERANDAQSESQMMPGADEGTQNLENGSSCILAHGISLFNAAFRSVHSKTENRVIVAIARSQRNYMIL